MKGRVVGTFLEIRTWGRRRAKKEQVEWREMTLALLANNEGSEEVQQWKFSLFRVKVPLDDTKD